MDTTSLMSNYHPLGYQVEEVVHLLKFAHEEQHPLTLQQYVYKKTL